MTLIVSRDSVVRRFLFFNPKTVKMAKKYQNVIKMVGLVCVCFEKIT